MGRADKAGVRQHVMRSLTLRNLRQNRLRTAVTVIGVALSCALLCAVLVSVNSFLTYMGDSMRVADGDWMASTQTTDEAAIAAARQNSQVTSLADITYVGQLQSFWPQVDAAEDVKGARREASDAVAAQLTIQAVGSDLTPACAVHLSEGRMPQNSHEIVLSRAYQDTCELTDEPCEVGSTVSGELAARTLVGGDGSALAPSVGYGTQGEERLAGTGQDVSYTVVGFYDTSVYLSTVVTNFDYVNLFQTSDGLTYASESATSSGDAPAVYARATSVALTYADSDLATATSALGQDDIHSVYLAASGISTENDLTSLVGGIFGENAPVTLNSNLLRFSLISSDRTIWATIYLIVAIICAVIVIASVSLIYNAFAISVAERTRQFGLLSSIGASRRQIRSMVMWEALVVAAVGIPLGLLIGVAGSTVVLNALSDRVANLFDSSLGVQFGACFDPVSLVAASALGLMVVALSAWMPSRKAAHVSAVDALRNTQDLRLSRRQLRLARRGSCDPWQAKGLGGRLLGVPGALAARTSVRGPAKARVAAASLVIAVMLFVSAGSLDLALGKLTGLDGAQETPYNVNVYLYASTDEPLTTQDATDLYRALGKLGGVEGKGSYLTASLSGSMPSSMVGSTTYTIYGYTDEQGNYQYQPFVCFLNDEDFNELANSLGLSSDQFYDSSNTCAIAYNGGYHTDGNTYVAANDYAQTGTVALLAYDGAVKEEVDEPTENVVDGQYALTSSYSEAVSASDQGVYLRSQYASTYGSLDVVAIMQADDKPSDIVLPDSACLVVPMSSADAVLGGLDLAQAESCSGSTAINFYFSATSASQACSQMETLIYQRMPYVYALIQNLDEARQQTVDLVTVFNTFSYAFSIILALVAVANVFNTLVSALMLRQREFAVLQSVGMTRAGISRMVAWECVRFGIKGLVGGLIASLVVSQLMFYALTLSFSGLAFEMPWSSVAIAVVVVILVTVAASAYGLKHAKADNVAEALRMQ